MQRKLYLDTNHSLKRRGFCLGRAVFAKTQFGRGESCTDIEKDRYRISSDRKPIFELPVDLRVGGGREGWIFVVKLHKSIWGMSWH